MKNYENNEAKREQRCVFYVTGKFNNSSSFFVIFSTPTQFIFFAF